MHRLAHALRSVACAALLALPVFAAPTVTLAHELGHPAAWRTPSRHPSQQQVGKSAADLAASLVGAPYGWGAAGPNAFDCSGLVIYVYGQFGIAGLEHTEVGMRAAGDPIGRDELRAGDVIVFQNTYRYGPSHAAIYLGDGQFVHAADEAHGVMVSSLDNDYWSSRFYAAARPHFPLAE